MTICVHFHRFTCVSLHSGVGVPMTMHMPILSQIHLCFSPLWCRSTYDPIISEALNEHISTPYFIPASLTDQEMSWIFMGSPGPGANIHVSIPP